MTNITVCPKCGQKNRIIENTMEKSKCVNCGALLGKDESWNPIVLIVFPAIWIWAQTQFYGMRLAEAIGGAIVILFLPLIIVFFAKTVKGVTYNNFTKHTFVGTLIVFILAIGSFINSNDGWKPPSEAGLAYRNGNFEKSAMLRKEACYGGDMENCSLLGSLYYDGEGVEQDKIMAEVLFKKACNGGNYGTCYYLGLTYELDDGVDASVAEKFYKKGCDGNDMDSCLELARIYNNGSGVYQSDLMEKEFSQKAKKLFEKACDNGNEEGYYGLGNMHNEGVGVQQNYFKAKSFYEKACSDGHMGACVELGTLHKEGKGTRKDFAKARKFYGKACDAKLDQGCRLYAELK